jgi:hypothetical protein
MRIAIDRDGTVTLYNGAVDIGQGSNTIMIQLAADALGVPAGSIRLVAGDTDLTLDAGKTSASRQAFVSGNAAKRAGEDLRRQILRLANAGEGARIAVGAGYIAVKDGVTVREIDLATLPEDGLSGTGSFDPPSAEDQEIRAACRRRPARTACGRRCRASHRLLRQQTVVQRHDRFDVAVHTEPRQHGGARFGADSASKIRIDEQPLQRAAERTSVGRRHEQSGQAVGHDFGNAIPVKIGNRRNFEALGNPAALDLPTDRARPPMPSMRPSPSRVTSPTALYAGVVQ